MPRKWGQTTFEKKCNETCTDKPFSPISSVRKKPKLAGGGRRANLVGDLEMAQQREVLNDVLKLWGMGGGW